VKPRLPVLAARSCSVALGSVSTAQVEPQPRLLLAEARLRLSASDLSYRGDGNTHVLEAHEDVHRDALLSGIRFVVPGLKLEVRWHQMR
jgi:hypothetical protein